MEAGSLVSGKRVGVKEKAGGKRKYEQINTNPNTPPPKYAATTAGLDSGTVRLESASKHSPRAEFRTA